ncbi:LysR family transcriptional regulator [Kosakonia sp. BYX6]|uniref:LysR family transcriptional regulator n=1 Tax=Kosakonia calanthes TaxID=3139408 RepID=A0ABZ3B5E9_9ENTR
MNNDIRNLDLNLLKTLDALLDERNVTRAAARLSLTQPAVSGMLTRLRDYFADPLFVRAPHGMIPTARAQELAAPVKRILADIDLLLKPTAFDPQTASLTWTLSATDYALKVVIVPFIARLKQRAPGIRIRVEPVEPKRLLSQLERGDIDAALMTPYSTPADLHSRALFEERFVCMMRADHPDAAKKTLTLERFCALEHALVSWDGERFRGVADNALAALGKTRRVGVSVSNFLILPEILAVSDMIAVVPQRLARLTPGMCLRDAPLPIPGFTKTLAWHERAHRDPAQQWLRALLYETSQADAPL